MAEQVILAQNTDAKIVFRFNSQAGSTRSRRADSEGKP